MVAEVTKKDLEASIDANLDILESMLADLRELVKLYREKDDRVPLSIYIVEGKQ